MPSTTQAVAPADMFNQLVRSWDKGRDERNAFHDLMRRRVREVLVVGSDYDCFVMEVDGVFVEQSFGEYFRLNLDSAPRITSAGDSAEALRLAGEREFDTVIVMAGNDFLPAVETSDRIRTELPHVPLLLLVVNNAVLSSIEAASPDLSSVDRVFVWNGYSKLFIGMLKFVEDLLNAGADADTGLVRVILLIEESVRQYSRFLPLLYHVILSQTQALIEEENGDGIYKLLRSRSRPKILLASDFEHASAILERHRTQLLAVISDIDFTREGGTEREAGLRFLSLARDGAPELPFVIQSAERADRQRVEDLGAAFLWRDSPSVEHELGQFLRGSLGFGPFLFRDHSGAVVAEARNMEAFIERIAELPPDIIIRHAEHNHFSIWLSARGEQRYARIIRPYHLDDFGEEEALRAFIVRVLSDIRHERSRGTVPAFDEAHFHDDDSFTRLASGSVGGKGRGLIFARSVINHLDLSAVIEGIDVKIPRTALVGIDEFERFLDVNGIFSFAFYEASPEEVIERFLASPLDLEFVERLRRFVLATDRPIAVRSSGLFEDMLMVPFSGIYETLLIPNSDSDPEVRLGQLCDAIRLVWASLFSSKAKSYFEVARYQREEERMAVVLQEVVGRRRGRWYYPHVSGTAQSYNYYPISYLKPEDGLCVAALGLGSWVVDGGASHRFCPRYPKLDVVQPERMRDSSQRSFRAIDLERSRPDLRAGEDAAIEELDIEEAENDPKFRFLASTWDPANDRIVPGCSSPGLRFIDLANILKHDALPLARLIDIVLDIGSRSMGSPVEIEYALNLDEETGRPAFYILQLKPLIRNDRGADVDLDSLPRDGYLLASERSMGNGRVGDVSDIIWIDPLRFDRAKTRDIAREIEGLDRRVAAEGRRHLLIGFGRWGTRDPWLGVPVAYSQIAHARVIVEADLEDFRVESSLGSHFFHNVTSMNIGYMTIPWKGGSSGSGGGADRGGVDWDWLRAAPRGGETEHCVWTRLEAPLDIVMDGKASKAVVFRTRREVAAPEDEVAGPGWGSDSAE